MSLPSDFFGRIVFILQKYGVSFLNGAGKTMAIALVGTLIGCIIGFAVGIVQTIPVDKKDNPVKRGVLGLIKLILNIYVEVFRGTPMMVQAMFIYYGSSVLFGFNMSRRLPLTLLYPLILVLTWRRRCAAASFPSIRDRQRARKPSV